MILEEQNHEGIAGAQYDSASICSRVVTGTALVVADSSFFVFPPPPNIFGVIADFSQLTCEEEPCMVNAIAETSGYRCDCEDPIQVRIRGCLPFLVSTPIVCDTLRDSCCRTLGTPHICGQGIINVNQVLCVRHVEPGQPNLCNGINLCNTQIEVIDENVCADRGVAVTVEFTFPPCPLLRRKRR